MIDQRTTNLNLPLPHQDNTLAEDVVRLRDSLSSIDAEFGKKGQANGYAGLDSGGKVPAAQLPSYVDDVLEYADLASFPVTGETSKIYVALDTNKTYRWSGSTYLEVSAFNLQPATASTLGGIKVGANLTIGDDGTLSAVVGGGGSGLPAFSELSITPTSNGQTVFTPAGGYVAGQIELYLNGVLLYGNGDDYTASNGTTITLGSGVNTTDTLLLRKWAYLPTANAVNKTGDSMTGALNESASVTLASGATLDIGTANANTINVTGTTTITSLGTAAAGVIRRLVFGAALTITHNATSLILPGAANITTAAGDVAEFLSLGGGNWRCLSYTAANTAPGQGTLKAYTYDNRANVRSTTPMDGDFCLIQELGVFQYVAGSAEVDDDETCFATASGRWILQAASGELVEAMQFFATDYQDQRLDSAETRLTSSETRLTSAETRLTAVETGAMKVLTNTGTSGLTTLAAVTQTSFTITVTGAVVGSTCIVTANHTLDPRIAFWGRVTATNTVTVYINNPSAAAATLTAAGAWRATVLQPF